MKKLVRKKKNNKPQNPPGVCVKVGRWKDLGPGVTLKFSFKRDGRVLEGFLFRQGGTTRAYLNECRHWTVGLDLDENRFFTADGRYLACMNHGALFDPSDGRCVEGPCAGAFLEPIPVIRRGATLYAQITNPPGKPPA